MWLEIAEQQYRALALDLRAEVDRRITELVENPTEPTDAVYNQHSDQWSVPLADRGFLSMGFPTLLSHPPSRCCPASPGATKYEHTLPQGGMLTTLATLANLDKIRPWMGPFG